MAALATSPHRGVYWDRGRERWVAQVRVDGRNRYVGAFDDENEAAEAARAYKPPRLATWEARVVESLCDSKRRRFTFAVARCRAERAHPPRARDMAAGDTLFDDRGEVTESPYDAFWRWCEMEYRGERTTRHRFTPEMLAAPDWSRPAKVAGHIKAVA